MRPEDYRQFWDFATPRQKEVIEAIEKAGSVRKAAEVLGMHERNAFAAIARLKKQARHAVELAQKGHAVGHWDSGVAPGYRMGKVTVQRANGEVERVWERQHPDFALIEALRANIEALTDDLPKLPRIKRKTKHVADDLMAVIPMGDPHFGMRAWAEECGEDFDLEIAQRDLCGAVARLVDQTQPCGRCLIVNVGDFFHVPTMKGVTPRGGHVMDMAGRSPEMYAAGVLAMRQSIETALEKHQVVEVINAMGNHDDLLSYALSQLLAHVYENNPRVKVHNEHKWRHYAEFGKNLIGVTHGDKTSDRDLPGIMATEMPAEWGRTKFRWFLRGHHHHDNKQEFNGCVVEQVRTLAAADSHTISHGHLSGRDMKAVLLHRDLGEVWRTRCDIDYLRSEAA